MENFCKDQQRLEYAIIGNSKCLQSSYTLGRGGRVGCHK